MGTVRSCMSFIISKGSRSSSFRSMSSISFARPSSSFRLAVTLGCGIAELTCASTSSALMLRTWVVLVFRSSRLMGRRLLSPLYWASRWFILVFSASYALLFLLYRSCQSASSFFSFFMRPPYRLG